MNITIIANGEYPRGSQALRHVQAADILVCCDGALAKYLDWIKLQPHNLTHPVYAVGDGDSLTPNLEQQALRQGIRAEVHKMDGQEDNDLTKAIHFAFDLMRQRSIAESSLTITLLGATGLREDHTLGNISLLAYHQQRHPDARIQLVSDYGTMRAVIGHGTFRADRGQEVSIFSLTPERPVSVSGLQYPIDQRPLGWWWEGTLNVALGGPFSVEGGLLIVYIAQEKDRRIS